MYKLVPLIILIYSNQVSALSCSQFEDLFIAECSSDGCGEILYIKKIGAFGPCSRKPTIAQPPDWAIDVLEYEVNKLEPTEKPILYELKLRKSAWNEYFGFQNIEQYRKDRATKDQQPIYFGGISQFPKSSLSAEKEKWRSVEKTRNRNHNIFRIANWLSLVIALGIMALTVRWFSSWSNGTKGWKWLAAGMLIHLVFVYLAINASMGSLHLLPTSVAIVVPGIWFYQLVVTLTGRNEKST